jgi:radical SAM superfamily enzyme YgiQ (UPF0313 family)
MIPIVTAENKNFNLPNLIKNKGLKILLCDLTHSNDGQLSSNVFPLGIGLIGSYLLDSDIGTYFDVELFKYPSDLSQRLSSAPFPCVIGFSNYSWTQEISIAYARRVKEISPNTIIVFGGPNYGLSEGELEIFWKNYGDCIDFNIVMEGERAFYLLMKSLLVYNFDTQTVKNDVDMLRNVHFYDVHKKIVKSEVVERLNIDDLPSPYLDNALMEKFFDGKLIPLTHSTRGCPFKCTFCSEGADYYNKVKQRTSRVYEEYRYIAQKATAVGVYDLMLSDANYGMFKEDSIRSTELAKVQAEYGYPKSVFVSTGKNQKDRVLAVVKKLDGAVQLSASLQTTNEDVLQNIERSNISIEALTTAAQEATESDVASYSELILGLPGETLYTHIKSILDVADAGFSNIRIYQLILLPQTPLNTSETRTKYRFKTKFRPMPRSYGNYEIFGSRIVAIEYEEIVTETSTLTYLEYSIARRIGMLVELVHNGRIFFEVAKLLTVLNIRWGEFLEIIFSKVMSSSLPQRLEKIMDDFIALMSERLYECKESLVEEVSGAEVHSLLVRLTTNELASTKAQIILDEFGLLNAFVYSSLKELFAIKQVEISIPLLDHMERFSLLSKSEPFENIPAERFAVDLDAKELKIFYQCVNFSESNLCEEQPSSSNVVLCHVDEQKQEINRLLKLYGNNDDGYGRIVMRSPIIHRFFRRLQKEVHAHQQIK